MPACPPPLATAVTWQWVAFGALSGSDVYALLSLRQDVFMLEQQCLFADIDGIDAHAMHLLGWRDTGARRQLVAYLRVLAAGVSFAECAIGRVVTSPSVRGTGMGRLLMAEGMRCIRALYPQQPVRIGAQQRLVRFYASFGFEEASAPYLEDGIVHVEMHTTTTGSP